MVGDTMEEPVALALATTDSVPMSVEDAARLEEAQREGSVVTE